MSLLKRPSCGRFFKTTLQGMVGLNPDYLLCRIDALAHALGIPTTVCLTKCDVADEEQHQAAFLDVKQFLKRLGSKTLVVKDSNDAVLAAERILQGYSPIFLCFAVTGAKIHELKLLLNVLVRRPSLLERNLRKAEPDLQTRSGDTVRLGPIINTSGNLLKDGFVSLRLSSIQVQDHPVEQLRAGSSGNFALRLSGKAKSVTPRALMSLLTFSSVGHIGQKSLSLVVRLSFVRML